MWYGSNPTTLGTPGGRSQCSIGQRRAVATTVSEGSGFTACGEPTLESSGTSKMLSLQAWQSARSTPWSSRPLLHGAQLARPPHEPFVEAAGVAAVLGLVGGGDQVVEAEGLGEGGDHVDRRRRREHQAVPLGPEGGQALGREGGDQLAQGGHGPPARRLHLVLAPAPRHPGRRPDEAHGEEVLAQAVVDGVEELVARQRAPLGQHTLLHQGPVEHLARGVAQQRPVEIDEDGALGHGRSA